MKHSAVHLFTVTQRNLDPVTNVTACPFTAAEDFMTLCRKQSNVSLSLAEDKLRTVTIPLESGLCYTSALQYCFVPSLTFIPPYQTTEADHLIFVT
jgi:hypothetical protein